MRLTNKWLRQHLLRDDMNETDIVQAYGGFNVLIDDLVESNYEEQLIDYALESPRGHERVSEAAYEANQNKIWGEAC